MTEGTGPMDRHLDEEQIFGLAEGGLDASARASAQAHLRGCAQCRRELEIAEGYFKGITDLESVKAPANFLANVRARLPRPSPLRAFLDIFMRPLRIIPMQVALLTILGLTAISSYLYQRGGLDESSQAPMSESVSSDPRAREPFAAKREEASTSTELSEPTAPAAPAPASPPAPMSRSKSAAKPFEAAEGLADGSDAAAKKAAGKGGAREDSPRQMPKPTLGGSASSSASPPAPLSGPRPEDKDVAVYEPESERTANIVADEKRRDVSKEVQAAPESKTIASREDYGSGMDNAASRKSKVAGTAGEKSEADDAGAGAIGSAELPAFIVTLAPGKRIGDVVSGLKAMGADSLSARAARDGGVTGKGMDYMFRVPASMRKDIAPYLERYGRVEGSGLLPATGAAPARIRIRFLP